MHAGRRRRVERPDRAATVIAARRSVANLDVRFGDTGRQITALRGVSVDIPEGA